jgi:hypothetical protein
LVYDQRGGTMGIPWAPIIAIVAVVTIIWIFRDEIARAFWKEIKDEIDKELGE